MLTTKTKGVKTMENKELEAYQKILQLAKWDWKNGEIHTRTYKTLEFILTEPEAFEILSRQFGTPDNPEIPAWGSYSKFLDALHQSAGSPSPDVFGATIEGTIQTRKGRDLHHDRMDNYIFQVAQVYHIENPFTVEIDLRDLTTK